MNPELLNNKFQISVEPGLDTRDPRFADIAGMVQQGKFFEAATQAQEIIEENIYDIRIICYFLYGFFDKSGPASLKNIFNSLKNILSENWAAVGPLKNRLKHAKKSIVWLFKQLNKILEYEKTKEGEKWQAWQADIPSDEIWDAMEISSELQKEIMNVFKDDAAQVVDGLSRTTAWLDTFYKLIYREPDTESELDTEPEENHGPDNLSCMQGDSTAPPAGIQSESVVAKAGYGNFLKDSYDILNGSESYLLHMLLKKMEVFSMFLKENKTAGAAMTANDINNIIDDFDPQIYFPDLFVEFTKQYALNVDRLLALKNAMILHYGDPWKNYTELILKLLSL